MPVGRGWGVACCGFHLKRKACSFLSLKHRWQGVLTPFGSDPPELHDLSQELLTYAMPPSCLFPRSCHLSVSSKNTGLRHGSSHWLINREGVSFPCRSPPAGGVLQGLEEQLWQTLGPHFSAPGFRCVYHGRSSCSFTPLSGRRDFGSFHSLGEKGPGGMEGWPLPLNGKEGGPGGRELGLCRLLAMTLGMSQSSWTLSLYD